MATPTGSIARLRQQPKFLISIRLRGLKGTEDAVHITKMRNLSHEQTFPAFRGRPIRISEKQFHPEALLGLQGNNQLGICLSGAAHQAGS